MSRRLPRNHIPMAKKQGKRLGALTKKVDKTKKYTVADAVALLTEISNAKFDESVELHFRLGIDPKKGDQQLRGTVSLPHGTGKEVRIAAFVPESKIAEAKAAGAVLAGDEELVGDIAKSQKTDFDVAVATPDMMPKIGKIAKILGTRGLMPNPKNDTVTPDPVKAIEELKKGKVAFKNDSTANLHLAVGKVSFGNEKLAENIESAVEAVKKAKPSGSKGTYLKAIHLTTTMGPSVAVHIGA